MQNRMFLGRAVRYLVAEKGVRQSLDIGTGLPTMNSVHEVAQSVDPQCHVVYMDNDPIVLAHGQTCCTGLAEPHGDHQARPEGPRGDLRRHRAARHPGPQPAGRCCSSVLHFIRDAEDPAASSHGWMSPLASGSYLVISHATADSHRELDEAIQVYTGSTSSMHNRSRTQIGELFDGLDIVDPDRVAVPVASRRDDGPRRRARQVAVLVRSRRQALKRLSDSLNDPSGSLKEPKHLITICVQYVYG